MNVSVGNELALSLTQTQNGSQILSSGSEVMTKQTFTYGTFEFTSRVDNVLSGSDSSGFLYAPDSLTEIDMEQVGNKPDAVDCTNWQGVSNFQDTQVFGYDMAIDYKSDNLESALAIACPGGVDLYFDNTGGAISDIVLRHLAVGARVVICGTASVSSWNPWPNGPRAERHLLVKRARMQGFVIFDYAPRFEEAVARLAQWIHDGRLRYSEDILNGIEHAPGAIAGLYRGENTGKRLVKIR
jgi:hypothetical protein